MNDCPHRDTSKCASCQRPHLAGDRTCPIYTKEQRRIDQKKINIESKPLGILQANLCKSREVQLSLLNNKLLEGIDILLISEPYIFNIDTEVSSIRLRHTSCLPRRQKPIQQLHDLATAT
jgi:hypothetical protein